MDENLANELKNFLKNMKLSNYEIRTYLTLLNSGNLSARDLSKRSRVPTGRIYNVLDTLNDQGMIEIQESRPKKYSALHPSEAFHSLVTRLEKENQKKISTFYDHAKILESKVDELFPKKEPSRVFWSTAFGTIPALSLYVKKFDDLQNELMMTGFLNENTINILPMAKEFYAAIRRAIFRGVKVKYLWSFEFDERPLSEIEIQKNKLLYGNLIKKFEELFGLSAKSKEIEMRYTYKRIPTYYDIFDERRVLIKLQNPLQPTRIFACMNVLDPGLASKLKREFNALWMVSMTA